jgi:hypothetical protein
VFYLSFKTKELMKHLLIVCGVIVSSATTIYAQTLYMPREVKEAFKKETRSPDGKPGKNYWQNYGRYNITITAMPPDRNIKGSETIMYVNNSPILYVTLLLSCF